ncbi:nucleoside 2-deoxyribosyltransferase [Paenisporosarcina cavernae]|uniref:Group-specific protein n=1 Tax=Paenisporosarcina cavernae TaxID=2320858 RepID=A0A385YVE5_9BACL|nr:nucleoside 2-deoxyribosyltransferase [Paenisporosarcina cavernae]AYC30514.1 group-specific protein [Paenisporosarcina cavernae]
MKFYIAASLRNRELVREVSMSLSLKGHIHTYDWTKNKQIESIEDLARIGSEEIEGVAAADTVIVLLPAGKGSHIEMGMGIALGKRVIIYSENTDLNLLAETSTFYHVPEVEQVIGPIEGLYDYLENKGRRECK